MLLGINSSSRRAVAAIDSQSDPSDETEFDVRIVERDRDLLDVRMNRRRKPGVVCVGHEIED